MLFGTLLLGATTTFVSCKDYDDDISNLQTQIDKLATADELTSQISTMTSAISTAKQEAVAQAEAAAKVATAAQSAADKAQSAADAAQAKADELEKSGATKTEVEAAQAAADAAKAAADEAATKAAADLEAAQKALQTAIDAAQKAADDAAAAAKQANEDLAAYKTSNSAAVEENATAIEKAQKAADAAAKAAADANTLADTANKLAASKITAAEAQAAISKALESYATAADLTALDNRLKKIEALLVADDATGAGKVDLAAMKASVDSIDTKLKALIGEYSTMVTSVSLYQTGIQHLSGSGCVSGYQYADGSYRYCSWYKSYNEGTGEYKWDYGYYTYSGGTPTFHSVDNVDTYVYTYGSTNPFYLSFEKVEEQTTKFPAKTGVADQQIEFKKGTTKTCYAYLYVRVSPTTAVLNMDSVHLMNSQGADLDEYVTCDSVYRNNTLLTTVSGTRSGENGLWTLRFKLKDDYDPESFAAAVKKDNSNILFSVAVTNTKLNGSDDRRVISEYGVAVNAYEASHAKNEFAISDLEGKFVYGSQIHNRYLKTELQEEPTTGIDEKVWKDDNSPATYENIKTDGDDFNAYTRKTADAAKLSDYKKDNRQYRSIIPVEVNKDIQIIVDPRLYDYSGSETGYGQYGSYNYNDSIKGFYVTLDNDYAIESGKSEYNAWNSYEYENVGTNSQKAKLIEGNVGTIKIKSNSTINDIIGFRIYAVNLDGTLVDPDGRAFYVAVGNAIQTSITVSGNVEAQEDYNASISDFIPVTGIPSNATCTLGNGVWSDENPKAKAHYFTVKYYKADKKTEITDGKDIKDAAYVRFVMPNAGYYLNDETYTQTLTLYDKNAEAGAMVKIKDIVFKMTKTLPSTHEPALTVRENQGRSDAEIYALLKPYTGNNIAAYAFPAVNSATIDFTQVFSNLDASDTHYTFTLTGAAYDTDGNVVNNTFGSTYSPSISTDFVDDKIHSLSYDYTYKKISAYMKDGSPVYEQDYKVTGKTFTTKLTDWHYNSSFSNAAWTSAYTKAGGNTIQWLSDGTGSATMDLANVDKIANSYNAELFTLTLANMVANDLVRYQNDAKLVGGDTYFSVSQSSNKLIFTQKNSNQAPQADISCKVQFTVKDAFGHKTTISLPVTVKKPVAK